MNIKTKCLKCESEITLDFGDLTHDQALAKIKEMDGMSRECPGRHVELGGWRRMWQLDKAVRDAYEYGKGDNTPLPAPKGFKEMAEELHAEYPEYTLYGAGPKEELAALGMEVFQSIPDLRHLGFGEFASDTHIFSRYDVPAGGRIYVAIPKDKEE